MGKARELSRLHVALGCRDLEPLCRIAIASVMGVREVVRGVVIDRVAIDMRKMVAWAREHQLDREDVANTIRRCVEGFGLASEADIIFARLAV